MARMILQDIINNQNKTKGGNIKVVSPTQPPATTPPATVPGTQPPVTTPPATLPSANSAGTFVFGLPGERTVSAGVFTVETNPVLVRTLWNNRRYPAGTNVGYWDGKMDDGTIAPNGNYTIDVLSNDAQYVWQGVIGNTSASFTGDNLFTRNDPAQDVIIVGEYGYVGEGFSEGKQAQAKFLLSNPSNLLPIGNLPKTAQSTTNLCSDGTYVFYGGVDAYGSTRRSFVFATKVSDDTQVIFPSGTPFTPGYSEPYSSVIDLNLDGAVGPEEIIYGMAVNSTYLFVSRPHQNKITVINKTTGAVVQVITSLLSPRKIHATNTHLWVVSGNGISNTIARYAINSNGTITFSPLALTGVTLPNPITVTVNPAGQLVVIDGTNSQIHFFNQTTGALVSSFGQAGGYSSETLISNDRWFFRYKGASQYKASIAFNTDGSFLLNDIGNTRILQFNADKSLKNKIISVGFSYGCQVDANNNTRLFSNYVEYKINYSIALQPGQPNGAWEQYRNWGFNVNTAHDIGQEPATARLNNVATLSNGRTYALLPRIDGQQKFEVIELVPTGGIRYTGIIPNVNNQNADTQTTMQPDGSLITQDMDENNEIFWKIKTLTSFDSSNNPIWSPAATLAKSGTLLATTLSRVEERDPVTMSTMKGRNTTTSGVKATFKPERSTGFHVGGIKVGTNKWLFKASPSTHREYYGEFPTDGSFDIGNSVEYAGGVMQTYDNHIFYNYVGEFWGAYSNPRAGQTNKWNHFYDNGLMIGQFGVVAEPDGPKGQAGMAGNAYGSAIAKVGNDFYLYHGDESIHAGVHRWKISNLASISKQSIAITTPFNYAAPVLPYTDLMAGLPFNADPLTNNAGGWVMSPAAVTPGTWDLRTSFKTYTKGYGDDIYIKRASNQGGSPATLQKDLGTNVNVTNWKFSAEIAFYGFPMVIGDNGGIRIEVLDDAGKVLCRWTQSTDYGHWYLKFNETMYASSDWSTGIPLLVNFEKLTLLEFSAVNGVLSCKYGPYGKMNAAMVDLTADWNNPKTFRISFGSQGQEMKASIARAKFYKNQVSVVEEQ